MLFMTCPRCGLKIRLRAAFLALERCPRCLARRGAVVPMNISSGVERRAPTPPTTPMHKDVGTT